MDTQKLQELSKLIRYWSLMMSTEAGSGHPTSSLSAADLMTTLFFGGNFHFDTRDISHPSNDRIIFSKGHASPLFYALWAAAGEISEKDLLSYRKFGSPLEGHPTSAFPMTEVATGSLGQGLSIGLGMALSAKYIDVSKANIFVLLGDSEMAEGSVWETMNVAAYYKLNNLIGIIDVNRLGQRGETMFGREIAEYQKRSEAFGWETLVVDGHSLDEIQEAYLSARKSQEKPVMIIANTIKGKGVSFLEDRDGWHGKALNREDFERARKELGDIDTSLRGFLVQPEKKLFPPKRSLKNTPATVSYEKGELVATRQAYGNALVHAEMISSDVVVLDAEVSNSTYADVFKKYSPERFFEMFIAEQNMVGAAVGMSKRGKIPFVSTFAAFFSRAFDQIRIAQYTGSNIKFVGSHCGVSIGEDGASQMGLEDIALFRSLLGSVVLYPSDAVSMNKLVDEILKYNGIAYIRSTRAVTPILYGMDEVFSIGGSKILRRSDNDAVTLVSAGITLFEAINAYDELRKEGISVRVIDMYSIKPLDVETLLNAARETRSLIVIEDHYQAGGIGEAVSMALSKESVEIHSLCVRKMPHSGTPDQLLDYEGISSRAIYEKVKSIV